MIIVLQTIIGYIFIVFGFLTFITSGKFEFVFVGAALGCIMISLSKVVEYLNDIRSRSLGLNLSNQQIRKIILKAPRIRFKSNTLQLYPVSECIYPFFKLDDEYYIRAKLFIHYLSQNGSEYTIALPNRDPLIVHCSKQYRPNINMFEMNEKVYIKLSILGLNIKDDHEGMVIDLNQINASGA